MTCSILLAAVSVAYLVYCINGEFTNELKSLSAKTLKSQAMSDKLRRHLHQQVHYQNNIFGRPQRKLPSPDCCILCVCLNPQLLEAGIA